MQMQICNYNNDLIMTLPWHEIYCYGAIRKAQFSQMIDYYRGDLAYIPKSYQN